jgi:hypothetical protein
MRLRKMQWRDRVSLVGLAFVATSSISTPNAIATDEPFMTEQNQNGGNPAPSAWKVEQWVGGRHRIKRFQSDDSRTTYDVTGQTGDINARADNNFPDQVNVERRRPINNASTLDPASADPTMRKPDKFVDNPEKDADGVRHFSNGKHFDLSKMSMDKALDIAKTPTPGTTPPAVHIGKRVNIGDAYLPSPNRPLANNFAPLWWLLSSLSK